MVTKKITSLQHPLVLEWVKLRQNRAFREKEKKLLISGEKMVCEVSVDTLIALNETPKVLAKDTYIVNEQILKKITGLTHPDGFAAIVSLPPPQDLTQKKYLLILDQISDPGNLGTLLRTALALDWEGVILTPGTVDLFNDKVLRSGKGAHFHLPYSYMEVEEILKMNVHFYTADLEGLELDEVEFQKPRALILSNESRGVSPWSELMAQKVKIPMNPNAESLNVAVSGGIILYKMRP